VGVIGLSAVQKRLPREQIFPLAILAAGGCMFAAACMSSLAPAMAFVAGMGVCAGAGYVVGFTILQENVEDELRGRIFAALYTLEPGGTEIGRRIRAVVLAPDLGDLDARAEALLMAADRAQHVAEVVEPALARGTDVVTDRFAGSSLAYQGFGRGLDVEEVRRLSTWAADGLEADLVVLLEVPLDIAARRRTAADDRMEAEGAAFHARVA